MNPFEQTIEILEKRGWTKGRMVSPTGRLCLQAAIVTAVDGCIRSTWSKEACEALRFFCGTAGIASIPTWNDQCGRTFEEVIEELRIVAKAWANKR